MTPDATAGPDRVPDGSVHVRVDQKGGSTTFIQLLWMYLWRYSDYVDLASKSWSYVYGQHFSDEGR